MNLFIVESPFQLLSAIEANNYFKNEENILIIKYSSYRTHKQNNAQMSLLKSYIDWNKVYEIESSISTKQSNLKLLFFIKKIKKDYTSINKILIGEYRSWVEREYFNVLNPKQCFILDDGNMTIELQKSFIPTAKYYYFGSSFLKKSIDKLQHKIFTFLLFGLNRTRKDINIFTCFNLEAHSRDQVIIKHSFEYLKGKNKQKEILKNTVYFFGGNLSELELISQEEEINILKKVFKYFINRNIKMVYLPHRRESSQKLEYIRDILRIPLRHSTYPAEIEFVVMEELPQYLASFMSTALHTVSSIVEFEEVIAFQIPYTIINKIYLEDIVTTYEEYRKTMKVIDLNELS